MADVGIAGKVILRRCGRIDVGIVGKAILRRGDRIDVGIVGCCFFGRLTSRQRAKCILGEDLLGQLYSLHTEI